jgi:copper(I)-binding protein
MNARLIAAAAASTLLASTGLALAHATLEVSEAPANSTYKADLAAWGETPAAGQDPHALAYPSPTLTIAAAGEADENHHHQGDATHDAAASEPVRAGDLVIEGAWTREPPPGAPVAGGYMTIINNGSEDDVLLRGSAPFAESFEVHEMSVVDGMMRMNEVAGGLRIPAGGSVALEPGGYHVMFTGLTDAPDEGETVDVTLTFERAGEVTVTMPVAAIGARGADARSHRDHD